MSVRLYSNNQASFLDYYFKVWFCYFIPSVRMTEPLELSNPLKHIFGVQ